jgi:hypothetical protein
MGIPGRWEMGMAPDRRRMEIMAIGITRSINPIVSMENIAKVIGAIEIMVNIDGMTILTLGNLNFFNR